HTAPRKNSLWSAPCLQIPAMCSDSHGQSDRVFSPGRMHPDRRGCRPCRSADPPYLPPSPPARSCGRVRGDCCTCRKRTGFPPPNWTRSSADAKRKTSSAGSGKPSCLSVVIHKQLRRLVYTDAVERRQIQFWFEPVPYVDGQILRGRYLILKLRDLLVKEAMIQHFNHFPVHDLLELLQIHHKTGARIHVAPHRNFKGVIVAVPVGIVALAEELPVFFGRQVRAVIKVRSRKLGFPRK